MSSTPQECYDIRIREEFEQTYTEGDILAKYCEEYGITLTPETMDAYDEDEFRDYKEILFDEYKELRE